MTVTYGFDGNVLIVRMIAEYEPADIRQAITAALAERQPEPMDGILFDVRASTALRRRTPNEIRAMAAFLAHVARDRKLRVALVADTDLAYGLMRLGAADVASVDVATMTFRDEVVAMAWASGAAST
jgi:hypothetical protein